MSETKYSQDWSGLRWKQIVEILGEAFEDLAAPPNQVVADAVHGQAEVSVFENSRGQYTAYKVEYNPIFWICGKCGKTTSFKTELEYKAGGGDYYYNLHAPGNHPAEGAG